ncbi:MAG: CPBP family intramembrane metalloprotease [Lachnospiraceae bacterium]|nr:CPBP family intramembrane metalloprotease [Lachnospiraceae bacterium]
MEGVKKFLKKIHTDRFRWTDEALFVMVTAVLVMGLVGEILAYPLCVLPFSGLVKADETGFWETFVMYFNFIGIWVAMILLIVIFKRNRPALKALWTAPKGNRLKFFGIGLLIGFGLNMICAIAAMLNKDISISFDSFQPVKLLLIFLAVFVQSSAEELTCRCYIYQLLRRGYRHPAVPILLNSLLFAALHSFNPGMGVIPVINLFLSGLMFSFMVYYMDSIWAAMAAHTAWNFTQNIILGLPNSGLVTPFSIFKLDAAAASDSAFYSVSFGIEGTIISVVALCAGCLGIYLFYRKKNVTPYDPWAA